MKTFGRWFERATVLIKTAWRNEVVERVETSGHVMAHNVITVVVAPSTNLLPAHSWISRYHSLNTSRVPFLDHVPCTRLSLTLPPWYASENHQHQVAGTIVHHYKRQHSRPKHDLTLTTAVPLLQICPTTPTMARNRPRRRWLI